MHYLILTVFFFLWFHRNACEKVRGGNSCMWGFAKTGEFHFFFSLWFQNKTENKVKSQIHSVKHTQYPVLFSQKEQTKMYLIKLRPKVLTKLNSY